MYIVTFLESRFIDGEFERIIFLQNRRPNICQAMAMFFRPRSFRVEWCSGIERWCRTEVFRSSVVWEYKWLSFGWSTATPVFSKMMMTRFRGGNVDKTLQPNEVLVAIRRSGGEIRMTRRIPRVNPVNNPTSSVCSDFPPCICSYVHPPTPPPKVKGSQP